MQHRIDLGTASSCLPKILNPKPSRTCRLPDPPASEVCALIHPVQLCAHPSFWTCAGKKSPGKLGPLEDRLFWQSELADAPIVVAPAI